MEEHIERTETVSLSAELITRVENQVERTRFDSKSEYIEFVLEEVFHQLEGRNERDRPMETESEVKERLETLGYLE